MCFFSSFPALKIIVFNILLFLFQAFSSQLFCGCQNDYCGHGEVIKVRCCRVIDAVCVTCALHSCWQLQHFQKMQILLLMSPTSGTEKKVGGKERRNKCFCHINVLQRECSIQGYIMCLLDILKKQKIQTLLRGFFFLIYMEAICMIFFKHNFYIIKGHPVSLNVRLQPFCFSSLLLIRC